MKQLEIGENEAGQRLDKYLKKLLPHAESSFLYKMLRKKNIVLNGKKAQGAVHLVNGDTVTLYLSDETYEKFSANKRPPALSAGSMPKLSVLYEDQDLFAGPVLLPGNFSGGPGAVGGDAPAALY